MKKILSLTLVLVLVLGSFPMAFADNHMASDFSDVEDEDVLKAVNRLSVFGIVDGYGDGTYKPDEMVTRAQFAKLLVTALGLENAASAAEGSSEFTDVTGNEWYAGFVNVAAGQGIVGGYPDGSFKPDATVNYGEAVTMLVRALGYKDEFLPGSWPSNYVAKAANLDITNDVTFFPTGNADRGSVAVLVNNTLDANIIEQNSFGDDNNWEESENDTLLSEDLAIDKYEDVRLVKVPRISNDVDENEVEFLKIDGKSEYNDYDEDEAGWKSIGTLEVSDDVMSTISNRLGESLNVYVDDDEVVYFETAESDFTVKWGSIADVSEDINESDKEITLTFTDNDDDDYDYQADDDKYSGDLYIDNESKSLDDLSDGAFGKFVMDEDGDIDLIDVHSFDVLAGIVTDADAETIKYFEGTSGSEEEFEADDYDKVVVTDAEGNVMNMSDIDDDAVIYINDDAEEEESGDEVAYVIVINNSETGVAEAYDTGNYEFETDDSEYDVNENDGSVSVDEDDEFEAYGSASDELETMTDEGATVKILLDIIGEVRHIRTDVDVSSNDQYGVVLGLTEDDYSEGEVTIKLLASDEDEYEYEVDDIDEFDGMPSSFSNTGNEIQILDLDEDGNYDDPVLSKGNFVKYTLNSDGEIDSLILLGDDKDGKTDNTINEDDFNLAYGTLEDDLEDDSIETDDGAFTVGSNILVFDASDAEADDTEVVTYESIIDNGDGKDVLVVSDDNGEAEFMVYFDGSFDSDDEYSAYLIDTKQKSGDDYVELALPGGDVVEYEVDKVEGDTTYSDLRDETSIVYEENADGTINITKVTQGDKYGNNSYDDDDDYQKNDFVVGQVIDTDGDYLRLQTTSTTGGTIDMTVKVDSDTVIYEEDDEINDNDIDDFDVIYVVKDASIAKVIKRYDFDPGEDLIDSEEDDFESDYEANTGNDLLDHNADKYPIDNEFDTTTRYMNFQ